MWEQVSALWAGEKYEDGKEQMRQVMESMALPAGYGWSFGFRTQMRDDEVRKISSPRCLPSLSGIRAVPVSTRFQEG